MAKNENNKKKKKLKPKKEKPIKNKKTESDKQKLSPFKKISIIVLALLFLGCVIVNGWYLYILTFKPAKVVSNTFEVGLQTLEDGTTKYFAEILLNRNKNNDGLNTFEVKYNYLVDEDKTNFYSQGQQFTSTNENMFGLSSVEQTTVTTKNGWYNAVKENRYYGQMWTTSNTEYYNYSSFDDYQTTTISTNPINEDTRFKIELGNDIYLMKFKNEYKEIDRRGPYYDFNLIYGYDYYNVYYTKIDNLYFINLLYNSLDSLKSGTSQSVLFEFGDLFDYYKYNEDKQDYILINQEDTDKVIHDVKSYYSILVRVNDSGAKKASDSLFNCINGNSNYNSTGDYSSSDYFIGRTIINLDIKSFEYVDTETLNVFKLKLKESTKNYYTKFKDTTLIQVIINLDEFKEKEIIFDGFTNNTFGELKVMAFTIETIDGEIVRTEVNINV